MLTYPGVSRQKYLTLIAVDHWTVTLVSACPLFVATFNAYVAVIVLHDLISRRVELIPDMKEIQEREQLVALPGIEPGFED
jgi:hypothetical protein